MHGLTENRHVAISSKEPLVVTAFEQFYNRLLRLDQGVENILKTAAEFPGEAVPQLASAYLWLFAQTPQGQKESGRYLDALTLLRDQLNPRETAWLRALRLWHERQFEAAAQAFEAILTRWPSDLLAVKGVEFLYYIMGQQENGPRFLAQMERLSAQHGSDPDFLAVKAFAHELCGQTGPARAFAEEALDLTPINPWAQHALEHVLLWEGSPEDAVDRLESWLGQWPQVGRIIYCHNAWHVAVMHLDRLNLDRAFGVYEEHVWGKSPEAVVEQLDSIAFLWRAEMAGVPVDSRRYEAIIPYIAPLAETLFMPFVSAHYAWALARAQEHETLSALLARVDERASMDDVEARYVWAPVGRSIIRGVADLAQNRADDAVGWFDPVMDKMMRIGGSDAQDDLFRFAHWDALAKAGRKSDARTHLERRLGFKPASPLERKLLTEW